MCASLPSYISLLNKWQSLSKRTQLYVHYNHEHHGCKGNVFRLRTEDRTGTSFVKDTVTMKSRAKTMRHNQTAQTLSPRVYLLERHALDRSYRFITWYIASKLTVSATSKSSCSRRAIFSPRGFCPFDIDSIVSPMGRTKPMSQGCMNLNLNLNLNLNDCNV